MTCANTFNRAKHQGRIDYENNGVLCSCGYIAGPFDSRADASDDLVGHYAKVGTLSLIADGRHEEKDKQRKKKQPLKDGERW